MQSLKDQFLVAMPSLSGSVFSQTITYLCEHGDEGAMGVVINQPLDLTLDQLFEDLRFAPPHDQSPAYYGGPVQTDRGFVLHPSGTEWTSTLPVTEDISLTASRDLVEAIAAGDAPEHYLVVLGYAGWGPGQLEDELADNSWLTLPADFDTLFITPADQRWASVARRLGVDPNLIPGSVGHA